MGGLPLRTISMVPTVHHGSTSIIMEGKDKKSIKTNQDVPNIFSMNHSFMFSIQDN